MQTDILVERYLHVFQNSLVFKNETGELCQDLIRSFVSMADIQFFTSGDYLLMCNDINKGFFFILDGLVDVQDEPEIIVATLSGSDHIGELGQLFPVEKQIISAISISI